MTFFASLRHLMRRLGRAPMFTAVCLLTLGVGIGANTAIFSLIYAVLWKPLPYPEPDRLVGVWQTAPGLNLREVNASPSTYFTYREESRTFEDIGLWRTESSTVTGFAEPEQLLALAVTDGTLPVLGVPPLKGRFFTREDDTPGTPETVILMHGYWQRRLGGDPSAIGKTLIIDGKPREIIGVMPATFRFANPAASLILPLRFNRAEVFIGNFSYEAVARLRPGVTLQQANADVARMLPLMKQKFQPIAGISMQMLETARFGPSLRLLHQDVVGDVGKTLWVLMATVGLVLLIACANVANLLLVRAEGRQHELAVRTALGASRGAVARQLLAESMLLGLGGGVLAVGLAYMGLRVLAAIAPGNVPRIEDVGLDPIVLAFTALLSVLAGILFGLVPVYAYARTGAAVNLHHGGRTASEGKERSRARNTLVVAQVAMAMVLLVSAGLMIRTLTAMQQVKPGFTAPDEVLTMRVSIPEAQTPDPVCTARMFREILERIEAVPSVQSVALTNSVTMDFFQSNDPIFAEGIPVAEGRIPPLRRFKFIAPGAFRTLGNPLKAGRDFTWEDIEETRSVVLVSESLAREYWGEPALAIGKRIRESPNGQWREIIGVAGDERDNGVDRPAPAIVYWPFLVRNWWHFPVRVERGPAIALRSTRAGTPALLKEVQQAIWSVSSSLPVARVRTLREIYDASMARSSFALVMLAVAAGMALLLGLVGIYGVISYSVSQRTREIGIRIALGAPQTSVRQMFLKRGLLLVGIGVVCGAALAVAASRLLSTLLYGVSPVDPMTYAAVSVALAAAALLATYVPARRATRVNPIQALRAE
jgi:putative ABC transport system permease protein